jgi:hypothetical protein
MSKKSKFLKDLEASILAEDHTFNMRDFTTDYFDYFDYDDDPDDVLPQVTCDTASCIAGHILAVRPGLARKFAKQYDDSSWTFDALAADVWYHETGEQCRLDFYGVNHTTKRFDNDAITRAEAVAHIRGTSEVWPQFERPQL